MTRDTLTGFLHGITLYPFLGYRPGCFDGWSDRKGWAYFAGVASFFAAAFAYGGVMMVSALEAAGR